MNLSENELIEQLLNQDKSPSMLNELLVVFSLYIKAEGTKIIEDEAFTSKPEEFCTALIKFKHDTV